MSIFSPNIGDLISVGSRLGIVVGKRAQEIGFVYISHVIEGVPRSETWWINRNSGGVRVISAC